MQLYMQSCYQEQCHCKQGKYKQLSNLSHFIQGFNDSLQPFTCNAWMPTRVFVNSLDLEMAKVQAFTMSLTSSQTHTFSPSPSSSVLESKQENGSTSKISHRGNWTQWIAYTSDQRNEMCSGEATWKWEKQGPKPTIINLEGQRKEAILRSPVAKVSWQEPQQ